MSHYDFLIKYLSPVCYIHSPVYYEDGTFSVMVEDAEGWNGTSDIFFDKEGNVIDRAEMSFLRERT